MSPSREQALALLRQHVENERMVKHCLASEAVLRALARRAGGDPERWGLAGLLHDIDVELTQAEPTRHAMEARPLLQPLGLDEELLDAIERHNEAACPRPRESTLHHLLAAGETVTGLIIATALVYPDKKLSSVKVKSIKKRMKEKAFAASVNRDIIRECEQGGVPLDDFLPLCLEAMQGIAGDLGL